MKIISLPANFEDRLRALEDQRGDWRASARALYESLERITNHLTTNRRDEPEPLSNEDAALAARLRLIC